MLKLDQPALKVPGIGPKYHALLQKLDLETVRDLIYHFPFRYDDFSQITSIKELTAGETVTLKGVFGPVTNIFTKNGKRLSKAKFTDFTGEIDIIWFNQHFIKNTIIPGKKYNVSGRVDLFTNKLCIIGPELEALDRLNLNTGRLVPIYTETAGITSRWLRTKINDILLHLEGPEEYLPEEILKKRELLDVKTALQGIHFPQSAIEAQTARYRFEYEEIFFELLKVEKRKRDWEQLANGHIISHRPELEAFITNLPFTLTESQQTAVTKIMAELAKPYPMNMLLEGDVGSGKTIVAIIAAFAAFLNKFKTIYLAPTEILAEQHFQTVKTFLSATGMKVGLATSANKILAAEYDILIGTHALLHLSAFPDNIALVVIDEQHRFGVEQRGQILENVKRDKVPNLLTMTATPIPRTLALTIYGDLSLATLQPNPALKRAVKTQVVTEAKRDEMYAWIKTQNQQTFVVCPLIETSDSMALENVKAAESEFVKLKSGLFKDIPIALIHGRMKPKEKQEVISQFREGKIKILVSTPVIEVGIDIPEAAIIVIESAERYGLASLHQLRGRVGRRGNQGFCFVVASTKNTTSISRLRSLEKIDNGMELAEIDMKMRGEGDIFSTTQHGFKKMQLFELAHTQLLDQAKTDAAEILTQIHHFPLLLAHLESGSGRLVKNN